MFSYVVCIILHFLQPPSVTLFALSDNVQRDHIGF